MILRYLQGLKWDVPLTQTTLHEHYKWKNETFPINPEPF
jgi:hypothetical protein